jgi:SAM-dependent methyltransferase
MQTALQQFIQHIQEAIGAADFVRLVLGNRRNKTSTLKNVYARLVTLKNTEQMSFVYRHERQDITKNLVVPAGIDHILQLLQTDFYNAELFTRYCTWQLTIQPTGKAKLHQSSTVSQQAAPSTHDKIKNRLIAAAGNLYLKELGITTAQGEVKKDKQDKYRQINHYTELLSHIVKDIQVEGDIKAVDMGSGKGYLTFALYDYLNHPTQVTGIEMRPDLVDTCTQVAQRAAFDGLRFVQSDIASANIEGTHLLVALHACDTATDDAIAKGIAAHSQVIVCAPCCHKQIRRQMEPVFPLSELTRHGIFMERQAEMVTDTLRALLLEMHGYKTRVFEFIATTHTPKNILIAAVFKGIQPKQQAACKEKIEAIKTLYGIQQHYLEKLLMV